MRVEIEIPDGEILNLISTFMDNRPYWGVVTECEPLFDFNWPIETGHFVVEPLDPDDDDLDFKPKRVTSNEILSGLRVMAEDYPRHFSDAVADNSDWETSDVFMQCCVLGDVIYG